VESWTVSEEAVVVVESLIDLSTEFAVVATLLLVLVLMGDDGNIDADDDDNGGASGKPKPGRQV